MHWHSGFFAAADINIANFSNRFFQGDKELLIEWKHLNIIPLHNINMTGSKRILNPAQACIPACRPT